MSNSLHFRPRPPNGSLAVGLVEPRVLVYLERVSGKVGQAALDAWLRFTGWDSEGRYQTAPEARLAQARRFAESAKGMLR